MTRGGGFKIRNCKDEALTPCLIDQSFQRICSFQLCLPDIQETPRHVVLELLVSSKRSAQLHPGDNPQEQFNTNENNNLKCFLYMSSAGPAV